MGLDASFVRKVVGEVVRNYLRREGFGWCLEEEGVNRLREIGLDGVKVFNNIFAGYIRYLDKPVYIAVFKCPLCSRTLCSPDFKKVFYKALTHYYMCKHKHS